MKVPCKVNEESGCPICKMVGKPDRVSVPVEDKKTGEVLMMSMSVKKWEEIKKLNPKKIMVDRK